MPHLALLEGSASAVTSPLNFTTKLAELSQPIIDAITSGVTSLLPIGITIMGIFIGVSLIPRMIYKFL